jgi:hypothetical protein
VREWRMINETLVIVTMLVLCTWNKVLILTLGFHDKTQAHDWYKKLGGYGVCSADQKVVYLGRNRH